MSSNTQIDKHVQAAVCEALGLQYLTGGNYSEPDTEGTQIPKTWIDYIWIATIKGYYRSDVTIGSAAFRDRRNATEVTQRAFLVISGWKEGDFQGKRPFKSLPVNTTNNVIVELLHQINLVPPVSYGAMDGPEDGAYFEIHTFFDGGFANMTFHRARLPSDENGKELWVQLKTLTDRLADAQDDPEIKTFIKDNLKRYF